MTRTLFLGAAALVVALAGPATAQMNHDHSTMTPPVEMPAGHGDHGSGGMNMGAVRGDQGPSSKAFAEANAKMHAAMDIEYSGDADVDFVKGMIAHHEGAIDMARILLDHGKDPELRTLAEEIITAQEAEVAMMKEWLAAKGIK